MSNYDADRPPDMPMVIVKDDTTLVCPHCGAEGLENFTYVEDIQNLRDLENLFEGTLMIQSHYEVADDGDNPRLGCKKCDGECRIPDDIECQWR
jgi:hypothetical protein